MKEAVLKKIAEMLDRYHDELEELEEMGYSCDNDYSERRDLLDGKLDAIGEIEYFIRNYEEA